MTERLDRFDLIAELASGGSATVFLARFTGEAGFQRLVAIKKLHPHLAQEPAFARTFLRDAGYAAALHHPNVVPILEIGTSPEGFYLVMDYIEGDTLAHLLARSVRLGVAIPLRVTVRVALDALAGLHALHELADDEGKALGMVHREISPRKILIGTDGVARVSDFGVAHAESQLATQRTRSKDKLAYMAPELLRGDPIDRRADLFSLAVVTWECLAHKRLFRGDTVDDTIDRVTTAAIPRIDQLRKEVPPALARALSRALERDVTWRAGTAADLAEAIEEAAAGADLIGTHREVAAHLEHVIGADLVRQRGQLRAWIDKSEPSIGFASGSHLIPAAELDKAIAIEAEEAPEPESERAKTTQVRAQDARLPTATAQTRNVPPPPPAADFSLPLPAPKAKDDAVPIRFGKYVVLGHLADGGMAEVYLARATGIEGFEKIVVVKRLKPGLAASETATQLFLQEARIAATLEHPQIAQVYDVGVVDGSYFFAMEHVYGEDLRKVMNAAIKRGRAVRLEDTLRVITELAGALHYAHEKRGPDGEPLGLVHRDVSPSNVLVSHDGAVKLCDFGVAEVTAGRNDGKQRVLAGKLSYMSPEQCRGDALDRRSDIFVLAVCLYELTTLTKLFKGKTDRDVVRQIVEGRVRPPSAIKPDYPPELERIVMKGLALEPDQRYQSAQAMRDDLEKFALEHRLALTASGLSHLMHALFSPDVQKWQAAVRAGHVPTLLESSGPDTPLPSDFDYAPVVELRKPRPWYRAFAALAVIAGAAALASIPLDLARSARADRAADEAKAAGARIAGRLGAQIRAVRSRADGIATTPMLRAAIETDARTMQDMIAREALFTPAAGETIAIYRTSGAAPVELLRMPATGTIAPLAAGTVSVAAKSQGIVLSASAAINALYAKDTGELVIAQSLDPKSLARELPATITRASLQGLAQPIWLARGAESGSSIDVPLVLDAEWHLPPLALSASLPPPSMTWLPSARWGSIGLTALFVALALVGRHRHRWWRTKKPARNAGGDR
ncbi:MAG TPA: serine/threonine-protein kinase [Kofleriaceae bacterium]|nr:serine/threonine-protein kinase [Kofleriaceae bacterium]